MTCASQQQRLGGFTLTAFRSNTPSFASCSKVTNLVVSRPRLFSCLLGVCGCNESPTAPSSPLMLADSSSIIARDQRRTSPCLPRPNPASEREGKRAPTAAAKQPGRPGRRPPGSGCTARRCDLVYAELFPSEIALNTPNAAIQWASIRRRAVGHARYDGTVQSLQGRSTNSHTRS